MKKVIISLIIIACVTFVSALNVLTYAGEIKIALDCPPDLNRCGTYVWSKTFSDYLIANGMKVKLYPDKALGNEDEKLDQVSQGLLEISNSYLGKASQLDPTINGFTLPYIFDSLEHADRVIANTDIMSKVNAGTTKKGVRILAMVSVGAFSGLHNSKKTIKTPADMKELRMRAMDKRQAMWFEAWGASSVIVPWAEIYNALQTGVADGYANPAIVPIMFKHTEVLKYFTDIKSGVPFRIIMCSDDWYKGLSKKERTIIDEGVRRATKANRAWQAKLEQSGIEGLKKAGVEVYMPTFEEREAFAKLIRPVYGKLISPEIAEMFLKAARANK